MSYLDWKVGDKVVCVDADRGLDKGRIPGWEIDDSGDWLREGAIYTIRRIGPDAIDCEIVVYLDEIRLSPTEDEIAYGKTDHGFFPCRFRKVQPRKTSIAIFEQLLHPSKKRERAPA